MLAAIYLARMFVAPPLHSGVARLMVGLHLLKHMEGLSDEDVCARWVENPYFQFFCGETFFRHDLPSTAPR